MRVGLDREELEAERGNFGGGEAGGEEAVETARGRGGGGVGIMRLGCRWGGFVGGRAVCECGFGGEFAGCEG